MEEKQAKAVRKFRGKTVILQLLAEQAQSGQSIQSFCAVRGIATGTFHNWKHKYSSGPVQEPAGFATLQVVPQPGLFAIVGSIKIYQPVSAAYLKELLS
jgi:hypothetical protein